MRTAHEIALLGCSLVDKYHLETAIPVKIDDGGVGGGYYGSYELTLAADGWKPARSEDDYEDTGGMDYYQCIYDAELSDSTSELPWNASGRSNQLCRESNPYQGSRRSRGEEARKGK